MTNKICVLVLLSLSGWASIISTSAFVPLQQQNRLATTTTLFLTSEEILARSRQAAGQPAEMISDSLPMVFDDDILADMQSALLKLEKRVQEGPGSLATAELDELTLELNRIMDEMHENPHKRHIKPVRQAAPASGDQPLPAQPQQQPAPTATAPPQPVAAPTMSPSPTSTSMKNDDSDDEGPAYNGAGGMGQPRGTVNTYIIEGMDEMTSEEYRLALQQSIIDTQRERRAAGQVGNRGSLDYLHSLSPGGTDSQKRNRQGNKSTSTSSSTDDDEEDLNERKNWSGWQK